MHSLDSQLMKLANNFTWKEKQFTWTVMPQDFTERPYFSQILKVDLDDIIFPIGSTLLQSLDDLLICSSQVFSQEDI